MKDRNDTLKNNFNLIIILEENKNQNRKEDKKEIKQLRRNKIVEKKFKG